MNRSVRSTVRSAALVALCACGLAAATAARAQAPAEETPGQRDARMAWWREAKFGLFIHWGVYAVPAGTYKGQQIPGIGEWILLRGKIPLSDYRAFAKDFTAAQYDPEAWVAMAKQAGMKYIVITSKHHDGFALFDTAVSDWSAVKAASAGRDLIAPLAAAARKAGLKFGLYYSQAQDWTHPGGAKSGLKDGEGWDDAQKGSFDAYLQKIAIPQTREILTKYQPDIIWWDTPHLMTPERAAPLDALLPLKPGIISNNRLGGGYRGDTETPEQFIPATGFKDRDWEVCMTMNDTWGYKSYDHNWKSTSDLIRKLADIVSKGGNFLLNVGPTAEGLIPPESIQRLKEVGDWMKVNGDSIYGTTASPFRRLPWGRCTTKAGAAGAMLYLHVFDWPADGKLNVPGLRSAVASAKLLATGAVVPAEKTEDGVTLSLPAKAPDAIDSVIAVQLDGAVTVEQPRPGPDASGAVTLTAKQADIHNHHGSDAKLAGTKEKPHVGDWSTAKVTVSWDVAVAKAGLYEVMADVAAAKETALSVECGKQKLAATVAATDGAETFREVSLGQLKIDTAGEVQIVLKPDANKWQPVNLRCLKLTPAK